MTDRLDKFFDQITDYEGKAELWEIDELASVFVEAEDDTEAGGKFLWVHLYINSVKWNS